MGFINDLLGAAINTGIEQIPAVTSAIIRSRAASGAARQQEEAQRVQLAADTQARQEALAALNQMRERQLAIAQPYAEAGTESVRTLRDLLAPGGELAKGFDQQFVAPTSEEVRGSDSYKFRMEEGEKALLRAASARGVLGSGGTAKAISRYGQDYASTEYDKEYDRRREEFDQQEQTFRANQTDRYGRLMGLTGVGQNAAGMEFGAEGGFGQNAAELAMHGGAAAGQAAVNIADIRGRGGVARSGIWSPIAGTAAGTTTRGVLDRLRRGGMTRSNVGAEEMDIFGQPRMRQINAPRTY